MKDNLIAIPSKEEVERYLKKWDDLDDYVVQEECLNKLFKDQYKYNTNLNEVLIKVCCLNTFYSTRVLNKELLPLAKHIIKGSSKNGVLTFLFCDVV